jgi:hypothetical protein
MAFACWFFAFAVFLSVGYHSLSFLITFCLVHGFSTGFKTHRTAAYIADIVQLKRGGELATTA